MGKGISGGYAPLSANLLTTQIGQVFYGSAVDQVQFHAGHTFGGNPVASAVGIAAIRQIFDDGIVENSRARGAQAMARLREMQERLPVIGDVRGEGLLIGVEFVRDPATRERYPADVNFGIRVREAARRRGLLLRASHWMLALAPPLTITAAEVDDMLDILEASLRGGARDRHAGTHARSAGGPPHDDIAGRRLAGPGIGALSGIVPPTISPLDALPRNRRGRDRAPGGARAPGRLAAGSSCWRLWRGRLAHRRASGASVVRAFVRAAAGRVPVLAGVMLPATEPAVEAARQAAAEGADAVVVGSPYYFGVDGTAQRRHIETVIEAADRPALLYNIPQCTHQVLAPATVADLARDGRVLGIKDSAGDFVAFQAFLAVKATRPDFRVLQGHEHLVAASLRMGGDGLVPGLANVVPALLVELRAAAARGTTAPPAPGSRARSWTSARSTRSGTGCPRSRRPAP